MAVERETLKTFDESLQRCGRNRTFLDKFYRRFLASSPKVQEKFAHTDFVRQKRALRASFHVLLLAAEEDGGGPEQFLERIARRHSKAELDIGSELYDLWLDSLLDTVREVDPEYDEEIGEAWERVMDVGIRYLLTHYHGV